MLDGQAGGKRAVAGGESHNFSGECDHDVNNKDGERESSITRVLQERYKFGYVSINSVSMFLISYLQRHVKFVIKSISLVLSLSSKVSCRRR